MYRGVTIYILNIYKKMLCQDCYCGFIHTFQCICIGKYTTKVSMNCLRLKLFSYFVAYIYGVLWNVEFM